MSDNDASTFTFFPDEDFDVFFFCELGVGSAFDAESTSVVLEVTFPSASNADVSPFVSLSIANVCMLDALVPVPIVNASKLNALADDTNVSPALLKDADVSAETGDVATT